MYKNPKYKPIEINSVKDRQKYLKNLHEEVNKSRMAVETIASFRISQMHFKKKIDQIQQQLHGCVSRINTQSKKNVVLKQLITSMKGEMFNLQKTQKREQQKNQQESEKKIKKIQYDIEQILQKHNEQIAKITSLKQSANSGRSQRVVFSNLFKKLQKQIKQNEQMYKENLMKSEVAKDKSANSKSSTKMTEKQYRDQEPILNKLSQTNNDILPQQVQFMSSGPLNENAFLTVPKYSYVVDGNEFKRQFKSTGKQSVNSQSNHDSKSSIQYENFLQKIKIFIGCDDFEKTIFFYQNIQINNQNLVNQIDLFNNEILRLQHQIHDINTQKKHLECIEKGRQLPLGSQRRIRTKSRSSSTETNQRNSFQNINDLLEISKIMGLNLTYDDEISQDDLKKLDMNIDLFMEEFRDDELIGNGSPSQINRATTATSQANAVDILLDRMERFSDCQKLLDKNLFKQEYIKQITKNKKHRNKK